MKFITFLLSFLLLSIVVVSCTPMSGERPFYKKNKIEIQKENSRDIVKKNGSNGIEKTLLLSLKEDPENLEIRKKLGMLYYKKGNYNTSMKLFQSLYNKDNSIFDISMPQKNFDHFYCFASSLIRLGKYNTARKHLFDNINVEILNEENLVKYNFLLIELDYKTESYANISEKIKNILSKKSVNRNLKLNLYYILADSELKSNNYIESLDNIDYLIGNDKKGKYLKKSKRLLDTIVNNSTDYFLEEWQGRITDTYRLIAAKSESNITFKNKIIRAINILENSSVSFETKTKVKKSDRSLISKIRIYTDKDYTTVMFASNDTINYVNPPHFDGKTLTLKLKNKDIFSDKNFITPPEGSGITKFTWTEENGLIVFKIDLSENSGMSLLPLSGYFEERKDASDKFALKLSIELPEMNYAGSLDPVYQGDDRYTIVLDPGHGGDDYGAMGVLKQKNGQKYNEKEMNLELCQEFKKYLEDKGYRVFLTRDKDYYPSLHERRRIAQNRNADMFISIHLNSAHRKNRKHWQSDRYYGCEMIVRNTTGVKPQFINFENVSKKEWKKKRSKALKAHKKLSNIFNGTIPASLDHPFNKKRRIKYKNLSIFSGMTIPHALIETGFIINNKTVKYLSSKKGQNKLFKGILKGIEEYRKTSYAQK
ncbi:MAG: N-acetylmuramoyl-L-alanine amidase [Candidatus Delongbacteria bacterium]|jgi:N-acetylmuramoyl-L-alanine amidase|nr:N-acetylmuramoyl-L-alanine amidase [Candidatus Delongbacteria bacterium]